MQHALHRCSKIINKPNTIIDIGAAKGSWTKSAMSYWPTSLYKLVEPLKEQIEKMPATLLNNNNVEIIEGVAGEKPGTIDFSISEDLDGSGIYGKRENTRKVSVFKLDEICKESTGPILLKLDTHGYEIPIFEGAKEILKLTEAIIVEVYGFYVSPTGKLFHEVSDYLLGKGFRLFDIVDIARRRKDRSFWQADAVYLPSKHWIFNDNSYN